MIGSLQEGISVGVPMGICTTTASSTYREITVAMAAPCTPMAGAPSFPKISTQFRNRLVTMAQMPATIGTTVSPASRRVLA